MRILTEGAIVVRILISLAFGAILGLDRGLKSRPAGLRTYILVCVGSCIVMMTNQYVYQVFDTGDPVRMAAQVVSGIGFLGAGTIIVTRRNQIRGLTTAAGLWASACVGLAIGIGLYEIALVGGLAVVIVLTSLGHWDFFIRRRARDIDVYIELPVSFSFAVFLEKLRQQGLGISNLQFSGGEGSASDRLGFVCTLSCAQRMDHALMLAAVRSIGPRISVEELS
ncbi:MAG: MgtC/SapB family protein [Spirochaetes bacterium]|uniref:MgtC/SapB family protein n=1 Tax=Candidatus Aphodenecus pullistercoris TaxID=2840669 RepID=A0A9D9H5Y3_9SPIR|nr:MgtC/SapB family protein [Candidatus Aphodenecus pullistercoris]